MPRCAFSLRLSLLLLIFLLLLPFNSFAMEAKITNFMITNTADNVLVYFRVKNCFTKKMEDAILAGIPTTFTFYVELHRERNFWIDKEVSYLEIKHTIKYDNVKKTFYVSLNDAEKGPEQFKDFKRAKMAMSDLNGIVIAPLKKLIRDKKYYVRVKVQLDKVRLPLHMEYVFFFVSMWDFETDWHREDFIY